MKTSRCLILLSIAVLVGCSGQPKMPIPTATALKLPSLGETKDTAIEVCQPQGQRAYLDRLACTDGSSLVYRRIASDGERNPLPVGLSHEQSNALIEKIITGAPLKPGETDHHVIDRYEISCGATKRVLFMDMYHCHQPSPIEIPTGFVLRK